MIAPQRNTKLTKKKYTLEITWYRWRWWFWLSSYKNWEQRNGIS